MIQCVCFWQALAQAQSGALQAAPGRSLAQPNPNNKQRYFHYFEWDDNTVFELSPLREEERFQTAGQIKQMGLLEHQKAWKVRRDLGTPGTQADAVLQWVDAGRAAVHVAGISALVMLVCWCGCDSLERYVALHALADCAALSDPWYCSPGHRGQL